MKTLWKMKLIVVVKVRDDHKMDDNVVLEDVEEVLDYVVNLDVDYVWHDVQVVGDIGLMMYVDVHVVVVDTMMFEVVVDESSGAEY